MKTDICSLAGGAALLVMIPLLLLWQSSNNSKGTSPGMSEYNVDHVGGLLTSFLADGYAEALDPICDYALTRDGNPAYVEAWLENIVLRRGESFYTHLTRGRIMAYRGNRAGAKREFAAAGTSAPNADAWKRLNMVMRGVGL